MLNKKEKAIFKAYDSGLSQRKVGALLGVSHRTVGNVLRRLGKKIRAFTPKYKLNEDVFDKITDKSAYWLGFLMADGCCSKRGTTYQVSLELSIKDYKHVEKFQNFLGTEKKICIITHKTGYNAGRKNALLTISSKKLYNKLGYFGIKPRKTFTAKPHPSVINNVHFWRGMIDGDGCISMVNTKSIRGTPRYIEIINLCGSKNCCKAFKSFCCRIVATKANLHKKDKIWQFALQAKKACAIISALYKPGYFALSRKSKLAFKCLKQRNMMSK
jgi:hypothetical protein